MSPQAEFQPLLHDRKILVTGIANHKSIAYGCARKLQQQGARLCITYLNEKARPYVEPLADQLGAEIFMPLDVSKPEQLDALFEEIETQWGTLHGLIHSIAYCPLEDLHAPLSHCSREGFAQALDISCYSFIDMARRAHPLMHHGGSLLNFSYLGSSMAVEDYNVMGVAKAALEATLSGTGTGAGPHPGELHLPWHHCHSGRQRHQTFRQADGLQPAKVGGRSAAHYR